MYTKIKCQKCNKIQEISNYCCKCGAILSKLIYYKSNDIESVIINMSYEYIFLKTIEGFEGLIRKDDVSNVDAITSTSHIIADIKSYSNKKHIIQFENGIVVNDSNKFIHVGEIVKGTVIEKKEDSIIANIEVSAMAICNMADKIKQIQIGDDFYGVVIDLENQDGLLEVDVLELINHCDLEPEYLYNQYMRQAKIDRYRIYDKKNDIFLNIEEGNHIDNYEDENHDDRYEDENHDDRYEDEKHDDSYEDESHEDGYYDDWGRDYADHSDYGRDYDDHSDWGRNYDDHSDYGWDYDNHSDYGRDYDDHCDLEIDCSDKKNS